MERQEPPQTLPEVLTRVYRAEALLTVAAAPVAANVTGVTFRFPAYGRTKHPMHHVSSVQISAAILEGTYCALQQGFEAGAFPPGVTREWFFKVAEQNEWLLLRLNARFRRPVEPGGADTLAFKLTDLSIQERRKRFLSITVEFDGFCSGDTIWVIDPPEQV